MSGIKFLKMTTLVVAALVAAGCGTTQPMSQAEPQAQYPRKVTLHTQDSLRNAWDAGKAFALIGKATSGESWELLSVTTKFPPVGAGQEVLLVSDDLTTWETTTPRLRDCSKSGTRYSVCGSTLATKDWLGYANYDSEAVIRAVNSIPDAQAKPIMQRYLEAEDAAQLAIYEEKSKQQAECYRSHDARTREIEEAGGKAMSAAIAGKPLDNAEMAAIRRAQLRMSASSSCGYNIQPPKKRASVLSAK